MSDGRKTKIFKPAHEEPGRFRLNYIMLPYGEFYQKTKVFLDAKRGDTLRFFNGPDVQIDSVHLIECDKVCDQLCRMRYGITWEKALRVWTRYAVLEGNSKDILSKRECILVFFYDAKD